LSNEDEEVTLVEFATDLDDTKPKSDEEEQGVEEDTTMLTVNTKLLDSAHSFGLSSAPLSNQPSQSVFFRTELEDEAVDSGQPPFQKPVFTVSDVIFDRPSLHQLLADSLNQDAKPPDDIESDILGRNDDGKSTTTLNCSSVMELSSTVEEDASFPEDLNPWEML